MPMVMEGGHSGDCRRSHSPNLRANLTTWPRGFRPHLPERELARRIWLPQMGGGGGDLPMVAVAAAGAPEQLARSTDRVGSTRLGPSCASNHQGDAASQAGGAAPEIPSLPASLPGHQCPARPQEALPESRWAGVSPLCTVRHCQGLPGRPGWEGHWTSCCQTCRPLSLQPPSSALGKSPLLTTQGDHPRGAKKI